MKRILALSLAVVLIVTMVACSDEEPEQPEVSSSGDETGDSSEDTDSSTSKDLIEKYNELSEKYNGLLNASHKLQKYATQEAKKLQELDNALNEFSTELEKVRNNRFASNVILKIKYDQALTKILEMEALILMQVSSLKENANKVYLLADYQAKRMQDFENQLKQKTNVLIGLRNLLKTKYEAHRGQATTPPAPNSRIILKADESKIASSRAPGVTRNTRTGEIVILRDSSAINNYASTHGYNAKGAQHAYTLSSRSGGMVGFADNPNALPQAINDMLSHMKDQMNRVDGDLELVFAIDYSGSMSDDIQGVIQGLVKIAGSLDAVKQANRSVKVGIVTFIGPGEEKLQLQLTENMVTVRASLERLLKDYDSNTGVDPGEAWYHGLNIAGSSIRWNSQNRMVILISDEESHEVAMNNTSYIRKVEQLNYYIWKVRKSVLHHIKNISFARDERNVFVNHLACSAMAFFLQVATRFVSV